MNNKRKRRVLTVAPALLNDVMEAIASMRTCKTLTVEKIIQKVRDNKNSSKSSGADPKNIIKALHRGIKMGLIKRSNGKFMLGLDSKDYAAYKFFSRQKKSRNLARKKVPKQVPLPPTSEEAGSSTSYDSGTSMEPIDKGRPRTRKRGRKNKRRSRSNKRRRRRSTTETEKSPCRSQSGTSEPSRTSTPSKQKEQKKEPDEPEKSGEESPTPHCSSSINCDNPNCLCNRFNRYHQEENGSPYL